MNILDKIAADTRREVELRKSLIPISHLEASPQMDRKPNSLAKALKESSSGIIAEHKRRSPSKAVINQRLGLEQVAKGYEAAGACGMSVLTDGKYFGGSLDDLILARASTALPLLRKEFIVDPYQIVEAKAFGADLILLIAALLSREEIKAYSQLAQEFGLEVLLEVHDLEELQKSLMPSLDLLGVNNRNLKTFEVDLGTSKKLSPHIPSDFVKVSESGISSTEAIVELREYGYRGFLIGEHFMKTEDPGKSASEFIKKLEP